MNVDYASDLAGKLDKAKRTGEGWIACCPAHDDNNPSLSIKNSSDGKLLVHCFVCKDQQKVISDLKNRGFWPYSEKNRAQPQKKPSWQEFWNSSYLLTSEHSAIANLYLQKRGITSPNCSSCRFHPSHPYIDNKKEIGSFPILIFQILKNSGEFIGIQRIYLSKDGSKASVPEPKKIWGAAKAGAIRLCEPNTILHVTEGPETALAIHQAINQPVWSLINANGLRSFDPPPSIEFLHVWSDLDRSGTGQESAQALARKLGTKIKVVLHTPPGPIPEDHKSLDWLDCLQTFGSGYLIRESHSVNLGSMPDVMKKDGWLPLKEIPEQKLQQEDISPDLIPEPLREWLCDIAYRMQVPLICVSVIAFTMIASVIGRKANVYPKQHDSWKEVPNVWCMIIMRSGLLKSPMFREVMKPLKNLIERHAKEYEEKGKSLKIKRSVIEAKIQGEKEKLKTHFRKSKANESALTDQVSDMVSNRIAALEVELENARVVERRYLINDATVEKIGEICRDNPNGLLNHRDELYGLLKIMEKNGREGDREFYLEAWNGNDSFDVDRVTRGHIHIPALCLSILGGIQPGKVESYVESAVFGGEGDDGLLQRFGLMISAELSKKYVLVDKVPNKTEFDKVLSIVSKLDVLETFDLGEKQDGVSCFHFSEEAQEQFNKFLIELEMRVRSDEEDCDAFRSHISKYRKLIPCLALQFYLIKLISMEKPQGDAIDVESIDLAIKWKKILEDQARGVYALALNPEIHCGIELAKKIKLGKVYDYYPIRILKRNGWKRLKFENSVELAITYLSELNWIKTEEIKLHTGAPSEVIRIHPDLLLPQGEI